MGVWNEPEPDILNRPKEKCLSSTGVGIMPIVSSSDSEEDDPSFGRYSALPQDLPETSSPQDDSEESSDNDESEEKEVDRNTETCAFDEATKVEVTELWNSPSPRLTDIVMDSTKVEQIKNAMAGFKLPSTAIPSWAENVPEEEWKERIINKVNSLNKPPAPGV